MTERYIKIQQISKSGEPNTRYKVGGLTKVGESTDVGQYHGLPQDLPTLTREEKTEIQSELIWEEHEKEN